MLKMKIPAKMHKSPSDSFFILLVRSMGLLPFAFAGSGFILIELLKALALLLPKQIQKPRKNHIPFSSPLSSSSTCMYYSLMPTDQMILLAHPFKCCLNCRSSPTLNIGHLSPCSLFVAGSLWFPVWFL